jgi:hypothetical protein
MPFGYGSSARPEFPRLNQQPAFAPRVPYRGFAFSPNRPQYSPALADRFRGSDRIPDRDRRRIGSFGPSYGYGYPGWWSYPYPYVIDPGFFDWGDSDTSAYDQQSPESGYEPLAPYPNDDGPPGETADQAYAAPSAPESMGAQRPAYQERGRSSPPRVDPPITVVFKDGRAPETMQNYMLTAKTLTDLDNQHYHEIPVDQIDLAATEKANLASGVDFRVPATSRD